MKALLFVACVLVYIAYASVTYSKLRPTRWYFPLALACEIIGNIIWVFLLRRATSQRELFFYTMLFDVAMVAIQIGIPVFFFGLRLTPLAGLGAAMTIAGVLLLRYELIQ